MALARTISVSVTETRQYCRLVRFLADCEALALENDELRELVDGCLRDLLSVDREVLGDAGRP